MWPESVSYYRIIELYIEKQLCVTTQLTNWHFASRAFHRAAWFCWRLVKTKHMNNRQSAIIKINKYNTMRIKKNRLSKNFTTINKHFSLDKRAYAVGVVFCWAFYWIKILFCYHRYFYCHCNQSWNSSRVDFFDSLCIGKVSEYEVFMWQIWDLYCIRKWKRTDHKPVSTWRRLDVNNVAGNEIQRFSEKKTRNISSRHK